MSRVLPLEEVDPSVFWRVPKVWEGEAFIIGGGPSLKGFDWDLVSSFPIVGTNDAYRLGPWIDYNIFGDSQWYYHHRSDLQYSTAINVGAVPKPLQAGNVKWLRRRQRQYTEEPGTIGWWGNTGMSGICLAILLGATKIRLLGFDMKLGPNGEGNWHLNPLVSKPGEGLYKRFMSTGSSLQKQLQDQRPDVEILNCNPDSAMDLWPKVELEDVL